MIQTIAVGTDGSDTASKAVEFALDVAEKFGAKVVVASSYRPVERGSAAARAADAPEDIQWSINPTEDVDNALRGVEEQARDRGLEARARRARETRPTSCARSPSSTAPTCWWSATRACSGACSEASRTACRTRPRARW